MEELRESEIQDLALSLKRACHAQEIVKQGDHPTCWMLGTSHGREKLGDQCSLRS